MEEFNELLRRKRENKIQKLKDDLTNGEPLKEIPPLNFSSNPNLHFIKDICKSNENTGFNDLFAVYNLSNDTSSVYIATKEVKENKTYQIIIYELSSLTKNPARLLSLKGHYTIVTMVKYFKDPYTEEEYLVSADKDNCAIIWKINGKLDYVKKKMISTNYERKKNVIYSCTLLFTQNKNYIMTTKFCFGNVYSRLIDMDSGIIFRNMKITKENKTRYLCQWLNLKDNNIYLIEFCANNLVLIYDPFSQDVYYNLQLKGDNYGGFVIKSQKLKTDLLLINNCNSGNIENGFNKDKENDNCFSNIYVFDLINKNLMFNFKIDSMIHHILAWNENFLIASDKYNKAIEVVDVFQKKVISTYKGVHTKPVKCCKKILLNDQELLFSYGGDYNIKLWVNSKNIIFNPLEEEPFD